MRCQWFTKVGADPFSSRWRMRRRVSELLRRMDLVGGKICHHFFSSSPGLAVGCEQDTFSGTTPEVTTPPALRVSARSPQAPLAFLAHGHNRTLRPLSSFNDESSSPLFRVRGSSLCESANDGPARGPGHGKRWSVPRSFHPSSSLFQIWLLPWVLSL